MVRSLWSKSARAGTPTPPLANCVTLDESLSLLMLHLSMEIITLLKSVTMNIKGVNIYKMLRTVPGNNQHHVSVYYIKTIF